MKYFNITYMNTKSIARLDEHIDRIKSEISAIGPMHPGSLSVQRRRGRDNKPYGAYWHLTWTAQGKVHTKYIPKVGLKQMRLETNNYCRFRRLIDRLVSLSIKRSLEVSAMAKSSVEGK